MSARAEKPRSGGWSLGYNSQTFVTSEDGQYFGVNQVLEPPHATDLLFVRSQITERWIDDIAAHVKSTYNNDPTPGIKFQSEPAIPLSFIRKLIEVGTQLLSQLPNVVEIGVPLCKDNGIPASIMELAANGEPLIQMPSAFDDTTTITAAKGTVRNELTDLPKLVLVGDLHGTFEALYTILKNEGLPSSKTHYIFNGDYVDRGSFSVEVFIVVLALFVRSPWSCVMLRGNHETRDVVLKYSFERELQAKYSKSLKPSESIRDISNLFIRCFQFLPLACTVNDYLILHGGIPARPYMSLDSIMSIKRVREPIPKFLKPGEQDEPLVRLEDGTIDASSKYVSSVELFDPLGDILWGDPSEEPGVKFNDTRQTSIKFDEDAVKQFLDRCKLKTLIRSHMNFNRGIKIMHNGRTITVFSVPNYLEKDVAAYIVFLKEADAKIDEEELTRRLEYTPPDLSKKANINILDIMGISYPDPSFREREPNGKNIVLLYRLFDTTENAYIANQPFSLAGINNMSGVLLQNLAYDMMSEYF